MTMYAIVSLDNDKAEIFYNQSHWVEVDPYYEDCPLNALMTENQMKKAVGDIAKAHPTMKVTIRTYEVPSGGFFYTNTNIKKINKELNE